MPVISEVSFVPRVDGDGSLGTESKKWDKVYSNEVVTDFVTSSTINTSTVNSTAVYDESNIRSYGAIGDGETDNTGALEAAIAHFDGADATILFQKGEYVIADDVIIPENICLKFEKGGKISVAEGSTLTINGPIEAGLWQIFYGEGTVGGHPKVQAILPEWFGAKCDASHDDREAIQKAIDLAIQGVKVVYFQKPKDGNTCYLLDSLHPRGDCSLFIPNTAHGLSLVSESSGENSGSYIGCTIGKRRDSSVWWQSVLYIDGTISNLSLKNIGIFALRCAAIVYVVYAIRSTFDKCTFASDPIGISAGGIAPDSPYAYIGLCLNGWQSTYTNVRTMARVGFLIGNRSGFSVTCSTFTSCYARHISHAGYILNKAVYSNFISCAADALYQCQTNGEQTISDIKANCGDNSVTSFIEDNARKIGNLNGYTAYYCGNIGFYHCGTEQTICGLSSDLTHNLTVDGLLHVDGGGVEAHADYCMYLSNCSGVIRNIFTQVKPGMQFRSGQKYFFKSFGGVASNDIDVLRVYGIPRSDINDDMQSSINAAPLYVDMDDCPKSTFKILQGVPGAKKLIIPIGLETGTNMVYTLSISGYCRRINCNSTGFNVYIFKGDILFRSTYGESGAIYDIQLKNHYNIDSVTTAGTGADKQLIIHLSGDATEGLYVQVDDYKRIANNFNAGVRPIYNLQGASLAV